MRVYCSCFGGKGKSPRQRRVLYRYVPTFKDHFGVVLVTKQSLHVRIELCCTDVVLIRALLFWFGCRRVAGKLLSVVDVAPHRYKVSYVWDRQPCNFINLTWTSPRTPPPFPCLPPLPPLPSPALPPPSLPSPSPCLSSPLFPDAHSLRGDERWRWHSRSVLRDVARFRQAALFAVEASAGPDGGGKDGHAAVQRVSKCYGYMWTFR